MSLSAGGGRRCARGKTSRGNPKPRVREMEKERGPAFPEAASAEASSREHRDRNSFRIPLQARQSQERERNTERFSPDSILRGGFGKISNPLAYRFLTDVSKDQPDQVNKCPAPAHPENFSCRAACCTAIRAGFRASRGRSPPSGGRGAGGAGVRRATGSSRCG